MMNYYFYLSCRTLDDTQQTSGFHRLFSRVGYLFTLSLFINVFVYFFL